MVSLVIVESPAKAKTLARILGKGYTVEASYGHVRDLPESADQIPAKFKKKEWSRLGVDVENDFDPIYVVSTEKKQHIARLKKELARADELLLATDEDREGESISWHVVELLKPKVPVRRIVFHEITDEAIHAAIANPRTIDENLVRAQESRRILDRLYGYELSPLLWKKVRRGLSAGRVQSVAVRLCVLREWARRRFRASNYWDAEAELEKDGRSFTARLVELDGQRVATGKDFDPDTGELKKGSKARQLDQEAVQGALSAWKDEALRVEQIEQKPQKRRAAPPFITATLQQEANRKLGFSARRTMSVAQRLYEGIEAGGDRVGLITYMRTDSVTLSKKALADAQRVIRERYGDEYTDGPRQYKTKSKGAQEAHEAIRPTEIARTPERAKPYLRADEQKLYELIWKRTVASQMADARLRLTSVRLAAGGSAETAEATPRGTFVANGKAIEFPGFLRAYEEGTDDRRRGGDREVFLPQLEEGESLVPETITAVPHETTPPARFTEASLVKALEAEGIGRPSTYASILDTIQNRGYVFKQGNALVPTFTAFAVTELLEKHFRDYVDTEFTAKMEGQLDDIAGGDLDWLGYLRRFYRGEGTEELGLEQRIKTQEPEIEYPAMAIGEHPETGAPIVAKVGRYGPYLLHEPEGGERTMASLPEELAPADLTVEHAVELLERSQRGSQPIGQDPETGETIYLASGRYGPYVQHGETPERGSKAPKPKRASLPAGFEESDVTLDAALRWLSLPRSLGKDPETGEEVIATSGRFGPYVKCGKETRSLEKTDDVYEIALERARELLAQPKAGRSRTARTVLKELGKDGDGNEIQLLEGRWGPYLTNGELNASLPKGADPKTLTPERASEILAERGKPPKRGRGRGAKKSTAKKSPAKRSTSKKSAKKKPAKKPAKKK